MNMHEITHKGKEVHTIEFTYPGNPSHKEIYSGVSDLVIDNFPLSEHDNKVRDEVIENMLNEILSYPAYRTDEGDSLWAFDEDTFSDIVTKLKESYK